MLNKAEKSTTRSQGSVSVGHPVNVASGVLYHSFEDIELPGRIPLVFPRRYSTGLLTVEPGIFGIGWHCELEKKIFRDLDGYSLTGSGGEANITFNTTDTRLNDGEVARDFGSFHELSIQSKELQVTSWNVETGSVTHEYYPIPKGDEETKIIRREDSEGNVLLFHYNNKKQLDKITQKREHRGLRLAYNDNGRLAAVYRTSESQSDKKQDDQAYLLYEYDELGRLIKFTDPLGSSSHYRYDDANRMINERTLAGMIYEFKFDKQGRCHYLSGENEFDLHRLNFNDLTRTTEVTNSSGHITSYHWNEYKQVEKVIVPSGRMISTQYDDDGRIIAEITPSGATTQYDYDEYGNRCSIASPDGATVKYTFNTHHQVISIADPMGSQWLREYDDKGHLVSLSNPLEAKQSFIYNDQGDLTSHQDGIGNKRQFKWDSAGNLMQATDWLGNASLYGWDAFGNLVNYKDAAGHETQMNRDRLGHLLELILPDGNKRQYEWDVYDNLKSYTDENKVKTRWSYCDCGNIEEEFKPDGNKIAYGWNAIPGQLAHLTNEKGELYHFDYDEDANLIKETDFSGAVTEYEYNNDGQINTVIKPSGHISRYKHDEAGRIMRVMHDDGTMINYEYDIRGLLVKADNKDCPVSFEYDVLGRLVREVQGKHTIEHEYDELNNRILRRSSLGDTTQFAWNPNGQIAKVQAENFDSIKFEYDTRGYESKRMLGSGMVFEQQVDQRGRLIKQTLNTQSTKSNDQIERNYQYDAAGNLLSKQDSLWGTTKYAYDTLERIESTLHPDQILELFYFDASSNITNHQEFPVKSNIFTQKNNTSIDWKYKKGNQLIEHDGIRYIYNADGQLISKTENDDKTHYCWNLLGQLTSIQKPDGSEWTYRYDVLSRRVEKRGPSTHIEYMWDGDSMLYEIHYTEKDSDEAYTHYWEYHPNGFSLLYKIENQEKQYFSINDQIGTPLELINGDGEIAWSERLKTFGRVKTQEKSRINCFIRFQGQFEDDESGLYYNRFRYYSPNIGGYISHDTIGLFANLNKNYYPSNPNSWVDPLGLTESCGTYEVYTDENGNQRIRFQANQAVTLKEASAGRNYSVEAHAGVNHLGQVVVHEGRHRAIGAAQGAAIPSELGGIPRRPGWLDYQYSGETDTTGPFVRDLTIDNTQPDLGRAEARRQRIEDTGYS